MTPSLDGRVAVVVGGGQTPGETIGNGRAAALLYARANAAVLVADRDLDSAEETAAMIRREGFRADAVRVDVTAAEDVAALADTALARFGRVDVLHNNVGIFVPGRTEDLAIDQWRHVVDVNLTGMWLTCKAFLPILRTTGNAAVVNISSLAGLIAAGSAIAYSTTKAAVNALTRSLALEYAPLGVRINCVAPGAVDTPLGVDLAVRASERTRDDVVAARNLAVPMGRQGSAWDVARAALFLASDDAQFITGAVLPVDGGAALVTVPDSASGRQSE